MRELEIQPVAIDAWRPLTVPAGLHRYRVALSDASGDDLAWSATLVRGERDGPVFLITAGVHGDEYEGMEGLRTFLTDCTPQQLCGTIIAIPVVNEPAFRSAGRVSPADNLDLARSFPGRSDGSPTEQIAYALGHHVLPLADFYCDLHSAGTHYEIVRLCGYQTGDSRLVERQRAACVAYGLPVIWATEYLPGRTLSAARQANVPAMYVEYAGGGGCAAEDVNHCAAALGRVAAGLGMLDRPFSTSFDGAFVEEQGESSGVLQAEGQCSRDGFFNAHVELWDPVRRGDAAGEIVDAFGRVIETLAAGRDGRIINLRRTRSVSAGDSCFSTIAATE